MSKSKSPRGIADAATVELRKRIDRIGRHLDVIDALLQDSVSLTDDQRKHSLRLQGDEEATALGGVLDYAEARPELFKTLANEDAGNDPDIFETRLLRSRLTNAQLLSGLVARLDRTRAPVADSALHVATLVKRPLLAAYEIAKPFQARDREHGKKLNAAVDLYRSRARAAVKSRQAHKAAAG